jgi:hypothetical protein
MAGKARPTRSVPFWKGSEAHPARTFSADYAERFDDGGWRLPAAAILYAAAPVVAVTSDQ